MAKKPVEPPKPGRALRKGERPKPAAPSAESEAAKTQKRWETRLIRATKDYDRWAKEYEVERCAKYYLGKHWHGVPVDQAQKRYAINMVFATVEAQLPSLLFSKPKVSVDPKPARVQEPGSDAAGRATLIESTLQTFIDDRDVHFTYETTLALRDVYPRFGVIEVGYTADWIDNPNADKPVLKEHSNDPLLEDDGTPVAQPKKVLKPGTREQLYVRRIPAKSLRVSPGRNQLLANDWVGYSEWHYVEDVKANPDYTGTADLEATGTLATHDDSVTSEDPDAQRYTDHVKLWKIWDLRARTRIVIAEGGTVPLQTKPFTDCPLAVLKFFEIEDAFYPLPPVYNWLSAQDEINETREAMKNHRRRFTRRYMREPSVGKTEFEKLETGEDGVCIEVGKVDPSPIMPIPDADLSAQNTTVELALTKDDFQQVAGVSGEARGTPQADTATQANIINVREQIRESRARGLVAEWLGDICRLMLLTIKEKMQLGMMVKLTVDPFLPAAQPPPPPSPPGAPGQPPTVGQPPQATPQARAAQEWREVQAEDLGELDVDISIDVASLSPVAEDTQRQSWSQVLALLTNPQLVAMLMTPNPAAPTEPSPMLRKTLALNGVKSDQEVREIWRIGQAALAQAAAAAQAQSQSQVDQPKINYTFKGEDLSNPLVSAAFVRAEGLQTLAALLASQKQPVPPSEGPPPGATALAKPAGPATGIPAGGPMPQ